MPEISTLAQQVKQNNVPLIAHVIFRLAVGGLENGLVNLINHSPRDRYRHVVVCLTGYTDFHRRITRGDVTFHALNKKQGIDFGLYFRLWRLFRELRPDIVHTRNLSAMEAQLPAFLAGIQHRVHSEHGREGSDLDGKYRNYNLLRQAFRPLIEKYIPLSQDLEFWLKEQIQVSPSKISQIYNGVDISRFHPVQEGRVQLPVSGFAPPGCMVIGTIGRMVHVKDQVTLVRAFLRLLESERESRDRLRLVMVGDGPLQDEALQLLKDAGAADLAWLPGSRDDVPALLRAFDVFVLPSLGEGISNTILEAMATGLPVIATRVGGNPELVVDGVTGRLIPAADPEAMAAALSELIRQPDRITDYGQAGRERVEREFSIKRMVSRYMYVYDAVLQRGEG